MHIHILQALVVLSCFIYGLGSTRLMYWILDIVLTKLPVFDILKNIITVISWFVGGGAVMLGLLKATNATTSLGIQGADGATVLCYMLGFGVGMLLIERWSKPSLIRDLKKYLTDDEIEVLFLILRYDVDPADAATKLKLTKEELNKIFASALKKLKDRGKSLTKAMVERAQDPPPPTVGSNAESTSRPDRG
jgi:hypothetical protein